MHLRRAITIGIGLSLIIGSWVVHRFEVDVLVAESTALTETAAFGFTVFAALIGVALLIATVLGAYPQRRRHLILAIGAVLLVGGWGATRYAVQQQRVYDGRYEESNWRNHGQLPYLGGLISMAVGAGFIGFAVLRPTNRKDE